VDDVITLGKVGHFLAFSVKQILDNCNLNFNNIDHIAPGHIQELSIGFCSYDVLESGLLYDDSYIGRANESPRGCSGAHIYTLQ
jgi:hypothetical protein